MINLSENKDYDYLVLQGCGGNLNEWVDGITDILKENKVASEDFKFNEVYVFENRDVTNLALSLNDEGLNIGKLAVFRFKILHFGTMWLSDYVNNFLYNEDINI